MATLQQIQNANWQLSADIAGEVVEGLADIRQCLYTILWTQKGTVCFNPDFGIDLLSYIDRPITDAQADLRREILVQVERYEPRAKIERIQFTRDGAQLLVSVFYTANSDPDSVSVRYNVVS